MNLPLFTELNSELWKFAYDHLKGAHIAYSEPHSCLIRIVTNPYNNYTTELLRSSPFISRGVKAERRKVASASHYASVLLLAFLTTLSRHWQKQLKKGFIFGISFEGIVVGRHGGTLAGHLICIVRKQRWMLA